MEERQAKLREMRICRFCLTEKDPLSNIYERDNKNAIPLPLQIMACVTIEVFANDGMPQLICDDCRLQTEKSYSFKTMCKKSDDSLKYFLATGVLKKQEKEDILKVPHFSYIQDNKQPPKRSMDSSSQTPIKRMKPNTADDTQIVRTSTEIIKENEATQDSFIHPEPFICEVTEEVVEQGEVAEKPKQVVTHCFSCRECERSFPLQQLLDIHMRQHTRERKYPCYECGKKFFSKHDLSKHVQTHSGEKPYVCVVCDKQFSRATLLHRHEKIHTTVPKYLCSYCDKTYLTSEDLDVHMDVHRKKRPFKCDHCDKSFAFKQGLERHEVIHNNDKEYKCNYCEASFNTPGKLARHVTGHAGTRPFPCKLCSRTFLLSHHLSRHLRNHYNKRSMENEKGEYKCEFCSMSFRRKDSLINHTAIHSMVNLKCVICDKEFGDAKTVKEHVSTHLASLPFPCDKCDYSFETQDELEDHEIKHDDKDFDDDDTNQEEEDEYILQNDSLEIVPNEHSSVRRSQRESKIKNYADFLKDEIGSDSEEDVDEPEEIKPEPQKIQIGSIQPVVRSETIKVYKGVKEKTEPKIIQIPLPENPPPPPPPPPKPDPPKESVPKSVTKITTLENLGISKQALDAMTEKSGFVEMKVGQKVIRVQKLMMTKAEYQAMSKKTKMEMKGGTVVVKNTEGGLDLKKLVQLTKGVVTDPLSDPQISETTVDMEPNVDIQVAKTPVRTYVKKTIIKKEGLSQEHSIEEQIKMVEINSDIDLTNTEDESTIKETELLF